MGAKQIEVVGSPMQQAFSLTEVATMVGLSPARVRAFVRWGLLNPSHDEKGESRFSFQDVVLLRTTSGLAAGKITGRRIRRALRQLKGQLPEGKPLTAVTLGSERGHLVARDGEEAWDPETGQALFGFAGQTSARSADTVGAPAKMRDPAKAVASDAPPQADKPVVRLLRVVAPPAKNEPPKPKGDADEWYQLGCILESDSQLRAREAYLRAIDSDSNHADAHLNLGRLCHDAGDLKEAEAHYRRALLGRPTDATAWFNLAVVLEDGGRLADAVQAYRSAIAANPKCADSHFNLGRLLERVGRRTEAFRHLKIYRDLAQSGA
jgi:Tfp pilus assembly protein PilF/DNA-binding transcriptional MerR regulator